jgi:phosphoglycerate dehydrogenase-like enzyme
LIAVLKTGQIAAAYLDVTDPEPLPPKHRLWRAPNCMITPHSAGGFATEEEALVNHFLENFRLWIGNDSLNDRVI